MQGQCELSTASPAAFQSISLAIVWPSSSLREIVHSPIRRLPKRVMACPMRGAPSTSVNRKNVSFTSHLLGKAAVGEPLDCLPMLKTWFQTGFVSLAMMKDCSLARQRPALSSTVTLTLALGPNRDNFGTFVAPIIRRPTHPGCRPPRSITEAPRPSAVAAPIVSAARATARLFDVVVKVEAARLLVGLQLPASIACTLGESRHGMTRSPNSVYSMKPFPSGSARSKIADLSVSGSPRRCMVAAKSSRLILPSPSASQARKASTAFLLFMPSPLLSAQAARKALGKMISLPCSGEARSDQVP
mmetsp:Transcript_2218/g.5188  ORF Transcript_2218/g.5188 Transcript_2218/m.5188 type:complete len:302 (-) Transcript_2218:131-1036(-)